jgi:arylsulfatase A-like enzyme
MIHLLPLLFGFTLLAAQPPNIVLIVSDDQGWRDFGFMGSGAVRTPHLDRLADTSAVFPNGYVPTALCRPSLATLLTGLHGHQHRITGNDPPDSIDRGEMLRHIRAVPTLPKLLARAGYRSLQTGKYWEGHYSEAGFTHGMTTEGRHGGPGLVIGRETMQPIYDFLAATRNRPFFLWYAPMMPHEPHNPPERLLSHYAIEGRNERLARYFAMVEWFDETCGQLLDHLDARGLRENTLVVFLVDNGWIQALAPAGHPELPRKVGFAARSKLSPNEGGLRTPVLLRWPGRVRPGRYLDLVSTIDIAPTILAAAGVDVPANLPGLNLLPVAAGQAPRLPRDAIFGSTFLHTARSADDPAQNLTSRWVRWRDWKLIAPAGRPPELYNVVVDPAETEDLAAQTPERAKALLGLLENWWKGN